MPETSLYAAAKRHLESQGYSVKGEICNCDAVGIQADGDGVSVAVIELKLSFTLDLVLQAVDRMAAASEFDDYRRADIRFHMAIAEASGVPRLVGLVGEVEAEVSELIAHIARPPEVLDHSNAEHARMIEALERHDATRAVRLLRRHLDGTVHILGGLFPPGHA